MAVDGQHIGFRQNLQQPPCLQRFDCRAEIEIAAEQENIESVAERQGGAGGVGHYLRSIESASGDTTNGVRGPGAEYIYSQILGGSTIDSRKAYFEEDLSLGGRNWYVQQIYRLPQSGRDGYGAIGAGQVFGGAVYEGCVVFKRYLNFLSGQLAIDLLLDAAVLRDRSEHRAKRGAAARSVPGA